MVAIPLEEMRSRVRSLGPRLRLAVLFGSHAAGRTHPESDIDIAVLPQPGTDLSELQGELSRLFRTDAVDVVDLSRAGGLISIRVAQQGKVIFECKPGTFAAFCAVAERRWEEERRRLPFLERRIDRWLKERGVS